MSAATSGHLAAKRVLVIDSTGRGHAICDLFVRTDPEVVVYYGPGCDVVSHPRISVVPEISLRDPATALAFLSANPVELVFVSNIDALSIGYADALRAHGHRTIGPSKAAAELESSKERGKQFCLSSGMATAKHRSFTDSQEAKSYVRSLPYACVVKVDGLCKNGDGSVVCDTAEEALAAIDRFAEQFGEALRLVVEQRLRGTEISIFALLDGESYLMFPTAMDFKRTLEGDDGINCDGMGSIAPHPMISPELEGLLRRSLLDPMLAGLRAEGLDFTGFIYVGAMLTDEGPHVIEINTRFGDSEAEVVLPSVQSNFFALSTSILERKLAEQELVVDELIRCSVALTQGCLDARDPAALPGWPFGAFESGQPVRGLDAVDQEEVALFYANLRKDSTGQPSTCGGRVLHVVGKGKIFDEAQERAYRQISHIGFPGMRFRNDIGSKLRGTVWRGVGHGAK